MKVALVQDGARGHYGLASALRRAGVLKTVYTEFYSRPGSFHSLVAEAVRMFSPALGKRMAERYSPQLEGVRIRQSLPLMAKIHLGARFVQPRSEYYKWASREVGRWVSRVGLGDSDAVIGFIRNIDPDLCRFCRQRGLKVVGDQMIAPAATEMAEMSIQHERWPGWQSGSDENDEYFRIIDDVERRTWESVDHIICPSSYVKNELGRHGVTADRVSVVNYAAGEAFSPQDRSASRGEITIGFMGSVCIRKGIQYFAEAAKRLAAYGNVRFVAVGPVELTDHGVRAVSEHVTLAGKVPRSATLDWFRKFDIFYFPSTCEGSAYVLMEAMATGLPIVTSPNSGTVARHGKEAFIAAYDAIDEHVAYLERLIADADLRLAMGASSASHYRSFDLEAYAERLSEVLAGVTSSCP